ncbi:MAG: hypothetical protein ACJ72B_01230 [Ornithinibacter sp.]
MRRERHEAGEQHHEHDGGDRDEVGGAEARVHLGNRLGEQPIAARREADPAPGDEVDEDDQTPGDGRDRDRGGLRRRTGGFSSPRCGTEGRVESSSEPSIWANTSSTGLVRNIDALSMTERGSVLRRGGGSDRTT